MLITFNSIKITFLSSFFTFSKRLLINLEILEFLSKSVLDFIYQIQHKFEMFPHGLIKFICNCFPNLFVEICTTFQSKSKTSRNSKVECSSEAQFSIIHWMSGNLGFFQETLWLSTCGDINRGNQSIRRYLLAGLFQRGVGRFPQ